MTVAGIPTETPGTGEVKLFARAGADRAADGTVNPLAGASFSFYRTTGADVLTDGTLVGSCTTDSTGACGLIASMGGANKAYFYAEQTAVPSGWTLATSWGGATDHVRYNTGQVTSGNTYELPGAGRAWPAVRNNPSIPVQCGLDVAMVVDLSNSVTKFAGASVFSTYKYAARDLVTVMAGSPTTMTVNTFATAAPAEGTANTPLSATSLLTSAGATTVKDKLSGLTGTPTEAAGYSNWDAGLHQAAGKGFDAVVMLTDGDPTASRSTLSGTAVNLLKMEEAIHSANAVKAGGTRVIVAGAGDEITSAGAAGLHRMTLVSGPTEGADFHADPVWADYDETLESVGNELETFGAGECVPTPSAATVTVTNAVKDGSGNPLSGAGWVFGSSITAATVSPPAATTNSSGQVLFSVNDDATAGGTWTLSVTQVQRAGFTLDRVSTKHATCTVDGSALAVTNTVGGFSIIVPSTGAVACTVTNTAVAPTYVPLSTQVKVQVKAGGDRLTNGSVAALPGALFELYTATSATQLTGGVVVGTCTTGSDGQCAVIVSLSGTSGYFYAVQTGAPSGWSIAETWGGAGDFVRFNTGQVSGAGTGQMPPAGRSWPVVRENPLAPDRCGLNVAVLAELSNSLTGTAANFTAYKSAAAGMVDVLQGTPSSMSVYTFGTAAPAPGTANATLTSTSVTRATGASTVRNKLLNLAAPNSKDGYANWDQGLALTAAKGHDVVVMLSDGDPTASRTNTDGNPSTLQKVEDAIFSANGVKAAGTRIVVGAGGTAATGANTLQRFSLISGPDRGVDFRVAELWADYDDALNAIAVDDCAGTVSVLNDVRASDGTLSPASGWTFSAALTGAAIQLTGTTSTAGAVAFTVRPAATGATVTETPLDGYEVWQQSGFNAACTTSFGASAPVTNVSYGFTVEVPPDVGVKCRVMNTYAPNDDVSIAKTSDVDPDGGGNPLVSDGSAVTWSYTVTNTGNIGLTDLLVTDDRGVTVTCPGGNPVPSLARGVSVVCTGTGTVSVDPAKMATLTDSFDSQDTQWTHWSTDVLVSAGRLQVNNLSSYPAITSSSLYDVRDSSVCTRVVPSTTNPNDETFLQVGGTDQWWNSDNHLTIVYSWNKLILRERVNGTNSDLEIPYSAVDHAWWRIREQAGTVYWETSPDGATWTARRSKTASFSVASVKMHLYAGNWMGETGGATYFDNVNLCP